MYGECMSHNIILCYINDYEIILFITQRTKQSGAGGCIMMVDSETQTSSIVLQRLQR